MNLPPPVGPAELAEPATTTDEDNGILTINEDMWKRILGLYLITYRGPNADRDLKLQLSNYKVLRRNNATVEKGRFVRYLPKGIVDSDLRPGGWVVNCNNKCVLLRRGDRQWRVSRGDNFIFVRDADSFDEGVKPSNKKAMIRLMAEEALRRDDEVTENRTRLRGNFVGGTDDE